MHGVTLPDDCARVLGVLDGADVLGEEVADLAGAVAGDEGDFARFPVRVEGAEEVEDVGERGRGPDLDADGVGDAAEELDVGVVDLAGAVADPEEVRRGVVVGLAGRRRGRRGHGGVLHVARQGLLVLEEEALVAGEELDRVEAGLAGLDGLEEAQGALDAARDGRVLGLELRVLDVAQAPVKGPVKIRDT